jgi:hypothetical protein
MEWAFIVAMAIFPAIILFLVLAYLVSNKKLKPPFERPAKVVVSTVTVGFFLFLAGALVLGMYDAADKDGWFPHRRTLSVWMSDDWLVGEFKSCFVSSDTLEANGSKEVSLILTCINHNGPLHTMNVEFRGSLDSLEEHSSSTWWNCQRKEDSITCKVK